MPLHILCMHKNTQHTPLRALPAHRNRTRRFDAPHYGAHANRLPGTTQRARGTCDVWSVPAERLGDAVVVVDEEGRGRKACPIRSCVCSSCCSGRALGFWEPGGSAINECSRILVMHSERAQTLDLSHTRPPKEEPREEELLVRTSHEWSATRHAVANAYKGGTVHIERNTNK